jgi:hypothetical protein
LKIALMGQTAPPGPANHTWAPRILVTQGAGKHQENPSPNCAEMPKGACKLKAFIRPSS